ncbi:membrane protein [Hydrogenimonas sp.]|nr:membrane protein [Hydrogenimonas sp.]
MIGFRIKSRTLKDLLKVLSGNIVAQGLGFATTVLVSRDLGPSEYGIFSLILAIFTILVQISDFGISTSYVKFTSEHLSERREIFTTVLAGKTLLSLIVALVAVFGADHISRFFFDSDKYGALISLISAAVLFHSIFSTVVAHYQALQNFRAYSMLKIFHSAMKLLTVVVVSFLFSKEQHIEYFILTYAYTVVLLLFALLYKNFRYLGGFNKRYLIEIYRLGFWIFLSSIATMIIMRLDIMMLQKMSTSVEVGYYSAALNLAMIFPLITASLVTTLLPKMESFLKQHTIKAYIFKVLSKTKYVVIVLIMLELISGYLVEAVYGSGYEGSVTVFRILLFAFIFGVIVNPVSLVMLSINRAHLLTLLNWIQLPLNYAGNLVFIPLLQAEGAAISTVILRIVGGAYIIIYLLKARDYDRET